MTQNPHVGSPFDDFLKEEGLFEEAHEIAIERVTVWQMAREVEENEGSKTEIKESGFSRSSASTIGERE